MKRAKNKNQTRKEKKKKRKKKGKDKNQQIEHRTWFEGKEQNKGRDNTWDFEWQVD